MDWESPDSATGSPFSQNYGLKQQVGGQKWLWLVDWLFFCWRPYQRVLACGQGSTFTRPIDWLPRPIPSAQLKCGFPTRPMPHTSLCLSSATVNNNVNRTTHARLL